MISICLTPCSADTIEWRSGKEAGSNLHISQRGNWRHFLTRAAGLHILNHAERDRIWLDVADRTALRRNVKGVGLTLIPLRPGYLYWHTDVPGRTVTEAWKKYWGSWVVEY